METEFHGGEGNELEEPEDEDTFALQNAPRHAFNTDVLNQILTRENEITAAAKKGRKKHADKQMKLFDDRFHAALHTPVRPNSVKLQDVQLAYTPKPCLLHCKYKTRSLSRCAVTSPISIALLTMATHPTSSKPQCCTTCGTQRKIANGSPWTKLCKARLTWLSY